MSTNKTRTVADLGIESSIRYAKDMELLDTRIVQDSQFIPQKTETSVLKPYIPKEFEHLFQVGKATTWALFAPPVGISGQNLFTYQLIPSLGGYEKTEEDSDRLASLEDVLKKPFARKQGESGDQEKEDEERERKILLHLLQCIDRLNKTLLFINSRRNQYQRG